MRKYKSDVYLVNTGWQGGAYGTGERISIKLTRQIITDILSGDLVKQEFVHNDLLNLKTPKSIENPASTWNSPNEYENQAKELIGLFKQNIKKFDISNQDILNAGPR